MAERTAGRTRPAALQVEDVRSMCFANAAVGRRGYAKDDVDLFLERIAKTFEGADDLTAAEIHHASFDRPPLGKRGYDEHEVDAFLDLVEDELIERSGVRAPRIPGARDGAAPLTVRAGEFQAG